VLVRVSVRVSVSVRVRVHVSARSNVTFMRRSMCRVRIRTLPCQCM
jgi:hypothetical protein